MHELSNSTSSSKLVSHANASTPDVNANVNALLSEQNPHRHIHINKKDTFVHLVKDHILSSVVSEFLHNIKHLKKVSELTSFEPLDSTPLAAIYCEMLDYLKPAYDEHTALEMLCQLGILVYVARTLVRNISHERLSTKYWHVEAQTRIRELSSTQGSDSTISRQNGNAMENCPNVMQQVVEVQTPSAGVRVSRETEAKKSKNFAKSSHVGSGKTSSSAKSSSSQATMATALLLQRRKVVELYNPHNYELLFPPHPLQYSMS